MWFRARRWLGDKEGVEEEEKVMPRLPLEVLAQRRGRRSSSRSKAKTRSRSRGRSRSKGRSRSRIRKEKEQDD